jgi:hypothetical protein
VTVTDKEFLPAALVVVVKVAVTLFAEVIVTVQVVAVPLHAPPQPLKVAPVSGVAVSVTVAPFVSLAAQVVSPEPHLIPPPEMVPSPVTETPSANSDAEPPEPVPVNEAVTLFAAFIVTEQFGDVPLHAPPHPLKLAPEPGCAVRVTVLFADSSELQLEPPEDVQEIPPPATTPLPVTETVSAKVDADFMKAAFTVESALTWTTQTLSFPEQGPPHPSKA